MSTSTMIVLGVIVVLVIWAIGVYNSLVSMRQRVNQAYADIDVQLRQRHDLVPNLVESVKGYMGHERETLEAVARARSAAMNTGVDIATRAVAEMALGSAVGNLFVTAERYPELKASQNFLLLQEQLTTTENRIAFARQHYNETVRQFNTLIAEFPWNLMAQRFGYSAEKMFAAEPLDRATVGMAS